ncbi:MAG: TIM barrel protein [Candidatus Theseobacter exili]|nr:TIM barrel protein [Candidatus Theseobacter exili]
MTKLNLGVDLSFAKKRWPEPEAWLEIIRDKLGLKYVEFDSDFLDPLYISEPTRSQVASEIRQLAKEYDILIHNYFTGTMTHCVNLISHPDERIRKDGIRWCEEAIKISAKLGTKGIGGHFDTISYRDWKDPKRCSLLINNLISSFQHLSKVAKEEGLEFILWEQMYAPSEVPYTINQTKELIEKVNNGASVPILAVVDVGHSCCQNYPHNPEDEDPYEWLKQTAHISPVIHIHQTNGVESCHWPFTKEYNKIGIIQREKVIKAIESSGAEEVLLVLEIFFSLAKNEEQILEEMKISVDYWKEVI